MLEKTEIILQYFREGKSEREISRTLGIHRKTVKRYLDLHKEELSSASEADNFYVVSPPEYSSSSRIKTALTDDVCVRIDILMALNKERENQGLHKQKLKKCDIHQILEDEGLEVGYTTVCNYIRAKERSSQEAFIRQQYAAGEVCEFDWGEVKLEIDGQMKRLQLSVFTPAYSNYRYARLFARQDTQSFQSAHVSFFRHCGGVFRTMVYDNMRVAISKFTGKSERELTDSFLSLSGFYKFGYRFCNIRRGNEKGHVERSVEYVRRKAFAARISFDSLHQANRHLLSILQRENQQTSREQDVSIDKLFVREQRELFALTGDYDCSTVASFHVDKYSCIQHDTNHYSVPDSYVGGRVTARISAEKIRLYDKGKYLCTHPRCQGKKQWRLNLEHYLKTLLRKPGALDSSIALAQADAQLRNLYKDYFTDNPRDFLRLVQYLSTGRMNLSDVFEAVNQVKKVSPHDISTDKIIVVCESILYPNAPQSTSDDICKHSNQQLEFITLLLNIKNQDNYVRKSD